MKKLAVLTALAVILTFSSCDEFFSTSFGSSRSYNSSNIDVNAGNIDEWVAAAAGNPELADAVIEAIIQELEKTTDPEEQAALVEGGVNLAAESAGLGESILAQAAELLGDADKLDEETVMDLLGKIQDEINAGGGAEASEKIAELVSFVIEDENGTPHFNDAYAAIARPGGVAEAILLLILGELGYIPDPNLENWSDLEYLTEGLKIEDGHVVVDAPPVPSPTSLALAAYLNLIIDNPVKYGKNPITKAIRDAFFGK